MSTLKNKIDFALVFAATNANPNGDPLNNNIPRTDYRGFGEVSDVCLKRKIRNRIMDMGGCVFVQSDDNRRDEYRSLRERYDACDEIKGKQGEEFVRAVCMKWFDVRAFGQVFPFKASTQKKKKGDSDNDGEGTDTSGDSSKGIRGPVSIQTAISKDIVNITSMQITKSVNLEKNEKDPDKKAADTMGMKHRVDFGLYTTFGPINVQQAEKTGFSEEDAELLKKALLTLFVNDETSARPSGSMEVVRLFWWKHNCASGQYSPAKVHRSLKITRKDGADDPHSADDYEITAEPLPGLTCEVLDGE